MIVPAFWSECRILAPRGAARRKQRVIRRFGWSDESPEAAAEHARERAEEAAERLESGQTLERFHEHKLAYGGHEGLPIREEIIEKRGVDVLTRNSYGALCLNTPDVLFADLDFPSPEARGAKFLARLAGALVLGGVLLWAGVELKSWKMLGGILLGWHGMGAALIALFRIGRAPGAVERVLEAVDRLKGWVAANPSWSFRVYETPNGLRALATHAVFDAKSDEVREFFSRVGVDSVYAVMCRQQDCFRARLTAKPWRCGQTSKSRVHRPAIGVWPIQDPSMLERWRNWVREYAAKAAGYAACRFVEAIGAEEMHPRVRQVVAWHDEVSGAISGKPLA